MDKTGDPINSAVKVRKFVEYLVTTAWTGNRW
jgi:hypothetical protein